MENCSTKCFIHISSSYETINKDIISKIFIEDGCLLFKLDNGFNEIEVKHINVINMELKGVDKLIYSNIQIKLLITEVNEKKQI